MRGAELYAAVDEQLLIENPDFLRPHPIDVIARCDVVLVLDGQWRTLVGQIGNDGFRVARGAVPLAHAMCLMLFPPCARALRLGSKVSANFRASRLPLPAAASARVR